MKKKPTQTTKKSTAKDLSLPDGKAKTLKGGLHGFPAQTPAPVGRAHY